MFGICKLSVVPCKAEPSHKSEMVTQLLFGETYQVLKEEEDWIHIKITFDNYECWIHKKQHTAITTEIAEQIAQSPLTIVSELIQPISCGIASMPITAGCSLPLVKGKDFKIADTEYQYEGAFKRIDFSSPKKKEVVEYAYLFLNSPYLWGGKSPFGIDCSGFTQLVYKLSGYKLPRDAYQQAELGTPLSFVDEGEPGDLAFFDNTEGKITHVGILLKNNKIIHSSGYVRIDNLDHQGIFNKELGKYTHNLRVLKRLF
ncbi:MAG: C40 family peptidase [Bacteroidetes bacterium]|nr:C40 family peptidase [Bacteroidota bacterium]